MGFGGSGVCACRWLLLASTLLKIVPCVVGDRASSQCVQLGQMQGEFDFERTTTFTIGTKEFHVRDISRLGSYIDYKLDKKGENEKPKDHLTHTCETETKDGFMRKDTIDYCPKNVEIRTKLVRQNGRVLRGWLHTEIELTDEKDDTMEFIYVQVRDKHFSAVGEFVTDEAEQCKTDRKGLVQPTPYQVYPCSAIGFREAKASSAVFVAKHSQYTNKTLDFPYITKDDLTRGIHFTWKLSEFWCSRHERFRFEANILTVQSPKARFGDRLLYRIAADYWLHPTWFGAADIKVGEEELDCKLPAIDYTTGNVSKEAAESWIQPTATRLTFGNDLTNPAFIGGDGLLANCVLDPWLKTDDEKKETEKLNMTTKPRFGGRCVSHTKNTPSSSYPQGCSFDTESPEFAGLNFQTYTDYKANITQGRLRECEQECAMLDPNNQSHLSEIQSFTAKSENRTTQKPSVSLYTLRKARGESRNTTFWQTRKFHGNLCVFVAMFIIPVSNFIARYYKETFLAHTHSIPLWLWVRWTHFNFESKSKSA